MAIVGASLKELIEHCEAQGLTNFVVIGIKEKGHERVDLFVFDNLGTSEAVEDALETAIDAVKTNNPKPDKKEPTWN